MPDTSLMDAPPAPAVPDVATPPPATPPISDPKPPAPTTEPVKDGPPADGSKPADDSQKANTPAVPEVYADPKLPEGFTLKPEIKAEFDALAKSLSLSQEAYQKVIDVQIKHQENEVKAAEQWRADRNAKWAEESKKELGPNPDETLRFAAKAIDRVFPDPKDAAAFRNELAASGLGNWNLMLRAFTYFGKAISEDRYVDGKPAPGAPDKTLAQRMYPNQPSNPNAF